MNISKKKAIRILEEIYQLAYHATLTGALKHGGQSLASTYNKIKELSTKNKWIDEDLIEILPVIAENEMANVGTAAKLLIAMLEDEEDEEIKEVEETEEYDENGYEMKSE